ncbi:MULTISPECIES: hypothetical protein [unclassified Actinoplanes]|uniref:hypothetical protein n=1 Tax=unclassified Actinoplanes TaxID=2626549 RepID=UPI0002E767DB|nr:MULTISPECIES: hypothetical protein [unclassified Actinoplanes]
MSAFRGLTAVLLLLGVAACDVAHDGEPLYTAGTPAPAGSGPAPAGFAPVGPGDRIQPGRQLTFATVQSGGRWMLTVGADGVVVLTDHLVDQALFVVTETTPGAGRFLLKTATGEQSCLQVHSPGRGSALRLKTAPCDPAQHDQIFTFPLAHDGKGVLIEVNGLYAFAATDGGPLVVQESGEGDAMTAFSVRDQGPA